MENNNEEETSCEKLRNSIIEIVNGIEDMDILNYIYIIVSDIVNEK